MVVVGFWMLWFVFGLIVVGVLFVLNCVWVFLWISIGFVGVFLFFLVGMGIG